MLRQCILLLVLLNLQACGLVYQGVQSGVSGVTKSQLIRQGRHGELTEQELVWSQTAWQYFVNNTQLSTGLVNSIDNYPTMDMTSLADYLISLQAALQFELISTKEHDERLTLAIDFLVKMPLTRQGVPNKVYSTSNRTMVNYANQPSELGWSAIDIGRLLIALAITKQHNPEFSEYIDKAVLRWNFCALVSEKGELYGGNISNNQVTRYKEGRLGIEEYAAYGYQDWQVIPKKTMMLEPYEVATVNGIDLLFDGRDPRFFDVLRPVFSTPYLWLGLEFNWDDINDDSSFDSTHSNAPLAAMADSVYQVQQSRWDKERIYTARAEHVVSGEPYFVYDAIYALGTPWITVAEDGSSHDLLALVSTRVAFQMWALWNTDYTERLMVLVQELYNPQRGWYEGRYEATSAYEKSITLKTNAGVLEALLYKANGKLYQAKNNKEYRDVRFNSRFNHPGKCLVETFDEL
ncbi:DUF3131 domain-containing protein [Shewanella pealeana]|uniref:DUF3131 domain-containing protein n=1 Tax=Shewanella pealeana (strain ATCC 700345 / ANG-SQ1) TaxID=398579 RepID=A8GZ86_SHEPA|nr:DUF3131 domain-containing protein [Shewanella pealeana]ABV85623.1 conserved hypothetical protein [Shewanella pealeana ATCC 700345]